jgi:hypothetical protein
LQHSMACAATVRRFRAFERQLIAVGMPAADLYRQ